MVEYVFDTEPLIAYLYAEPGHETVADDRVAEHEELIASEVRADEVAAVSDGYRREWDVEGVDVEIAIAPVAESAA